MDDNNNKLPSRDVVKGIAHDQASNMVPLKITGEPDFYAYATVVSEFADDIERNIRKAKND
jgi:hypothetical protein